MSSNEIVDSRAIATAYLEEHKLLRLFGILGAKIVAEKPDDVNAFILAELSKAAVMSARGQPLALFQDKDVEVMFGVFDLTKRGYLTQTQYLRALSAVGIDTPQLKMPMGDAIDKKTFVAYM